MASESSSAVLDLNDGNDDDVTEDTDAPSVTDDDANEAVPLIMEHGYDIAVKVDAPIKQLSTLETFVTYRVRCVCARWPAPPSVRRRYNHFRALHKRLAGAHPLVAVPPLPPHHSPREQLDRYSPSFVAVRTLALHYFLWRVARHPILTHSEHLRTFLTAPDADLERAYRSDAPALPRWPRPPDTRVKDPEFTSAVDYLTSLQQKLTTLCALTVKLHKGSLATGHELTGMQRVCSTWADSTTGAESRGAGAVCAGAGAGAAAARIGPGAPLAARARAALPPLAAYCQAHVDKIRQRDALHAMYVSGNNTTGDLHNRLEQASEALRCELADWAPRTRGEARALLLALAEAQVQAHAHALLGWETALQLSSEANVDELFKTVSKACVQNLSPAKRAGTPADAERHFDQCSSEESSKVDGESASEEGASEEAVQDPLQQFADIDLAS